MFPHDLILPLLTGLSAAFRSQTAASTSPGTIGVPEGWF